jgi:hypothetical protein
MLSPGNEFERRMVEIARRHKDLESVVAGLGSRAVIEHFGYTVQIGTEASPLVSGVQQSEILAMQADAWFVLEYISSCVITDGIPWYCLDSGAVQIQLTDTGQGHTLYSTPSSAGVLTATISRPQTGIPFLLAIPRLIPPNTNIKIDATQFADDATTIDAIFVSLIGSRVAMV